MSYVMYIIGILNKVGAEKTQENKKMLDDSVREVLGMQHADWQEVWKRVKALLQDSAKWKLFEADVIKVLSKKLVAG